MHSLSLIAVAVLGTLYALAWHDQPARNPEKKSPAENLAKPQQDRKT